MTSTNWDDVASTATTTVADTLIMSGDRRIRIDDLFQTIPSPVIILTIDGLDCDPPGGDVDCDLVTVGVTDAPKIWWDESVDAFSLTKRLFLGDSAVTNSTDPFVNVNRAVDDTGLGAGANGHCFSDSSTITRTGGNIAYNSFDARITVSGTANYNHFACFQAAITLNTSGTTGILYGFVDSSVVSAGVVTNRYGLYVFDVTGAGVVTNNYGVFVPVLAKGGTLNYAIRTTSPTMCYFGGNISVGGLPDLAMSIYVGGAHTQTTLYGIMTEATNAGSIVGFNAKGTSTGAGNLSLIISLYAQMIHDSSGWLANFYGVYCAGVNNGGLVYDAHALLVADMTGTGTVNNQYGLHVKPLAKGGTMNTAVYIEGSAAAANVMAINSPSTAASLFGGVVTVGGLVMTDATNIVLNATTGTKIGTAASQKLGFFNATPRVQCAKASFNNWAAFGDVVNALVSLGFFDVS